MISNGSVCTPTLIYISSPNLFCELHPVVYSTFPDRNLKLRTLPKFAAPTVPSPNCNTAQTQNLWYSIFPPPQITPRLPNHHHSILSPSGFLRSPLPPVPPKPPSPLCGLLQHHSACPLCFCCCCRATQSLHSTQSDACVHIHDTLKHMHKQRSITNPLNLTATPRISNDLSVLLYLSLPQFFFFK